MKSAANSVVILALLVSGCRRGDATSAAGAPRAPVVAVVNYPLSYFVDRLGADQVEVALPVPAGVDPAHWQPDPEVIGIFQQADLILLNGAGHARWVGLATLPDERLVDTSAAFRADYLAGAAQLHAHGPEGPHSHGAFQSTTWLDPRQAAQQAAATRDALLALPGVNGARVTAAFGALNAELLELDRQFATFLQPYQQTPMLASHPVYGYFARRYQLQLHAFAWEPDQLPPEAEWAGLRASLSTPPARIMLWEAQPLPETVARLSALGIESVVFDPCGNRPAAGDYLTVMAGNLQRLRVALLEM